VYAISAAARRNQGVDIGAAYEALPPE
jgi:hypothetical protein